MNIGEKIRYRRMQLRMSQRELARKMGYMSALFNFVSVKENGQNNGKALLSQMTFSKALETAIPVTAITPFL